MRRTRETSEERHRRTQNATEERLRKAAERQANPPLTGYGSGFGAKKKRALQKKAMKAYENLSKKIGTARVLQRGPNYLSRTWFLSGTPEHDDVITLIEAERRGISFGPSQHVIMAEAAAVLETAAQELAQHAEDEETAVMPWDEDAIFQDDAVVARRITTLKNRIKSWGRTSRIGHLSPERQRYKRDLQRKAQQEIARIRYSVRNREYLSTIVGVQGLLNRGDETEE